MIHGTLREGDPKNTQYGMMAAQAANGAPDHRRLGSWGSAMSVPDDLRPHRKVERPQTPDHAYADADVLLGQLRAHDPVTGEHVSRVACLAMEIALIQGVPVERIPMIEVGARLHDIGKLGIPDEILKKPSALDASEWAVIRRHPLLGGDLLATIPSLAPAAETVAAHHERWDGAGYPHQLAGTDIPLDARIFAVADSIDAMHADRPYRRGMSWSVVRAELGSGAGAQWDPALCDLLLGRFDRIMALDLGCPPSHRALRVTE
ncbi:MAG: HD domain-containing protein [Dehalococcoidia bacterium]|nr:MAG: HD domain-containing protein [Dehalococcoidia bacterium]